MSASISARASAAPPPCSASRKKAQVPFAETLDQPGLGQELEMARDARLRLPQDVGEIGHGQFGLGQQREDAQPRLLACGLERRIEGIETELSVTAHLTNIGRFGASSHYIRICFIR